MKKLVGIIFTLIMVFSFGNVVYASNTEDMCNKEKEKIEYECGKSIILENITIMNNGYICVTDEVCEKVTIEDKIERADTDKEKTKVFSHIIYDRNGIELATLYSTVTGIYSEVDNYAMLISITGIYTGEYANRCTYDSEIDEDTGYINIYFNGTLLTTMTYKIYPNGNIQNI